MYLQRVLDGHTRSRAGSLERKVSGILPTGYTGLSLASKLP